MIFGCHIFNAMNRRLLESYIRESLLLELHKDEEKQDRLHKARGLLWDFISWKKLLWAAIISGALSGPFAAYNIWKIIRKILFGDGSEAEDEDDDDEENPIMKEGEKLKKIFDEWWNAKEDGQKDPEVENQVNRIIQTDYINKYNDKQVKERVQGAEKVLGKIIKLSELKK